MSRFVVFALCIIRILKATVDLTCFPRSKDKTASSQDAIFCQILIVCLTWMTSLFSNLLTIVYFKQLQIAHYKVWLMTYTKYGCPWQHDIIIIIAGYIETYPYFFLFSLFILKHIMESNWIDHASDICMSQRSHLNANRIMILQWNLSITTVKPVYNDSETCL